MCQEIRPKEAAFLAFLKVMRHMFSEEIVPTTTSLSTTATTIQDHTSTTQTTKHLLWNKILNQSTTVVVDIVPKGDPRSKGQSITVTFILKHLLKTRYLDQTLTRLSVSSRSRPISGSRSRTRSRFRGFLSLGIGLGLGLEAWTFFGTL